jgi:hypothetical protein
MNMNRYLSKSFIILLLLILISSSCNSTKEAIYLLPDGYTGAVVILFVQPDGITLSVENGFNVYKIPESGVLKVKSEPILTVHNEKFFYEKANGERTPIEYVHPTGRGKTWSDNPKTFDQIKPDDNTVYAMRREVGTFHTGVSQPTRFRSFLIGKVSEGEKLYKQLENRINELNF